MDPQPQASLYETTIENAALEDALERREKAKVKRGEAQKAFKKVDAEAKTLIKGLDLADAPVRVGRYVITQHDRPGRNVSFETGPSTRYTISMLDEAA